MQPETKQCVLATWAKGGLPPVLPICIVDKLDLLGDARRKRVRVVADRARAVLAHGLLSDALIRHIMMFLDYGAVTWCSVSSMAMYGVTWGGNTQSSFVAFVKPWSLLGWNSIHQVRDVIIPYAVSAASVRRVLERVHNASKLQLLVGKENHEWFADWLVAYPVLLSRLTLFDMPTLPKEAPSLAQLMYLRLDNTPLDRDQVSQLASLPCLSALEHLELMLTMNDVDRAAALLSVTDKCKVLHELCLVVPPSPDVVTPIEHVLDGLPTTLLSLRIHAPSGSRPVELFFADCLGRVGRFRQLRQLHLGLFLFAGSLARVIMLLDNVPSLKDLGVAVLDPTKLWKSTRNVRPDLQMLRAFFTEAFCNLDVLNAWLAGHVEVDKVLWWQQFDYLEAKDFSKLDAPSMERLSAKFTRRPDRKQVVHAIGQAQYTSLNLILPKSCTVVDASVFESKRPSPMLRMLGMHGGIVCDDALITAVLGRFPKLERLTIEDSYGAYKLSLTVLLRLLRTVSIVNIVTSVPISYGVGMLQFIDGLVEVISTKSSEHEFQWGLPVPLGWIGEVLAQTNGMGMPMGERETSVPVVWGLAS